MWTCVVCLRQWTCDGCVWKTEVSILAIDLIILHNDNILIHSSVTTALHTEGSFIQYSLVLFSVQLSSFPPLHTTPYTALPFQCPTQIDKAWLDHGHQLSWLMTPDTTTWSHCSTLPLQLSRKSYIPPHTDIGQGAICPSLPLPTTVCSPDLWTPLNLKGWRARYHWVIQALASFMPWSH